MRIMADEKECDNNRWLKNTGGILVLSINQIQIWESGNEFGKSNITNALLFMERIRSPSSMNNFHCLQLSFEAKKNGAFSNVKERGGGGGGGGRVNSHNP